MLLQNNAEIVERQFGLLLGEIAEGRPLTWHHRLLSPTRLARRISGPSHLRPGGCRVDTTVCCGKILMQGKKIISMDEERLAARSCELAPKMWERLQQL